MEDTELDLAELTADEYQSRVSDAIEAAASQDGITWLTEGGRRVAAIVPVDVAEHHGQVIAEVLATPVGKRHREVKFPDVRVKLTGTDSSTGAILHLVATAMRAGGVAERDVDDFTAAVLGCDSYDAVLRLVAATVTTE
jgi:hypothetical protein